MNRSPIRRLRSVISLAMSTLPHTARASGSRRQRGQLTLIVGQRRPTGFCHQAWLGSKGNRTAIPFVCAPVTVPASTMAPPACVTAAGGILSSAWRWRQPVRNWLRSGPASWSSIRCCMDCVTKSPTTACSPLVGDGSGSRCSCGVSFSAPAVSWGPPPIAGAYNVGARRR